VVIRFVIRVFPTKEDTEAIAHANEDTLRVDTFIEFPVKDDIARLDTVMAFPVTEDT